jgi:hypothetical protein
MKRFLRRIGCGRFPARMRIRGRNASLVAVLVALVAAPAAPAHVSRSAGPLRLEFGWRVEPPYSGSTNAVEVAVSDGSGAPVADPRARLVAQVSFGETTRDLELRPAGGSGRFAATIVPTRPGVYAFRVTGTFRGRRVDVGATCSQSTFECVTGPGALQFPVADPSASQLDSKLDRALARADRSADKAGRAQAIAIGALVAAALAMLAAFGLGLRRGRQG